MSTSSSIEAQLASGFPGHDYDEPTPIGGASIVLGSAWYFVGLMSVAVWLEFRDVLSVRCALPLTRYHRLQRRPIRLLSEAGAGSLGGRSSEHIRIWDVSG
jgi:hypothetical protein